MVKVQWRYGESTNEVR